MVLTWSTQPIPVSGISEKNRSAEAAHRSPVTTAPMKRLVRFVVALCRKANYAAVLDDLDAIAIEPWLPQPGLSFGTAWALIASFT